MSYLMTHFWPGATEDQYRATVAAVHPPEGLPPGQVLHVAGPTLGGFLVSALWASKEAADAFMSESLLPALPIEGGFAGAPEERLAHAVSVIGG